MNYSQYVSMFGEEQEITGSSLEGFENNEFKMYLQFIVDNKTKNIVLAEALSRWDRGEDGIVGPAEYIANMERFGIISRLDFYMFDTVCCQLEKWADTDMKDIAISCNFTRLTLSDCEFKDKIQKITNSYRFDHTKLAIEITEDISEKDSGMVKKNVEYCKELGFHVYLDDLGCGYASLVNLCDYPVDVVKIDREILLKAETEKGRILFDGIIELAHNLDIKVICEGVETKEQNDLVSASDCDYIQGWYYSKVLPVSECEKIIASDISEKGRV